VQPHYAELLAQVIPVIGLALIVEMRQLDKRIKEARADAAPDSTKVGLVPAWLSFFAMASLAVSEVLCLLVAGGAQSPAAIDRMVLGSLFFAIVVTFLVPPTAWLRRLSRYWVRPLVTISTLGVIAGMFSFGIASILSLNFLSGDEPRIGSTPGVCGLGGCGSGTRLYEWDLDPRTRPTVTATFRKGEPLLYESNTDSLSGTLYPREDDCPGARVEWGLTIGTQVVTRGILNPRQGGVELNEQVPRDIDTVTITARRIDDQPCGTVFIWSEPEIHRWLW
jgi:hypothetical protein